MKNFNFDKSLVGAIVGLIIIITICIWSQKYLQNTSDSMVDRIDTIAQNIQYGDWDMAYKEQKKLIEEWADNREGWLILLEETTISEIESLFIRIEQLIKLQEKEDVLVQLADLDMLISEIPIKEKAYWNHIL